MSEALEPLDEKLPRALLRADAYSQDSDAGDRVEEIQTHLSHVFLTGDRVYKLRKAVELGFVSFGTRAERNADCVHEVRLNRRLAPEIYLGVARVEQWAGSYRVGTPIPDPALLDSATEHCVVMRRLPAGRDAASMLERAALRPEHIDATARRIARFHREASLGVPAPFGEKEWLERIARPVEANFASLERAPETALGSRKEFNTLRQRSREALVDYAQHFETRRAAGRAVDGHGDLHLQHLWFLDDDAEPVVIDCVEFDPELRRIDVASEMAFLAMDLGYRGRSDLGERVLRRYARETDDFHLYSVVDFFVSYRAAVRAKVAAIAAEDTSIGVSQRERSVESAAHHIRCASQALESRPPGPLVLVGGVVGAGKSTVARAIEDLFPGVAISSDRVRKHLAGVAVATRAESEPGAGLYTPEQIDRVYEQLLVRADPVLHSGRCAILDATFARRAHRARVQHYASERNIRCLFVEARCGRQETLERLRERRAIGNDASDAGPELYETSCAAWENLAEWPSQDRLQLDTDNDDWRGHLEAFLRSRVEARNS